jgi:hypothetical protein
MAGSARSGLASFVVRCAASVEISRRAHAPFGALIPRGVDAAAVFWAEVGIEGLLLGRSRGGKGGEGGTELEQARDWCGGRERRDQQRGWGKVEGIGRGGGGGGGREAWIAGGRGGFVVVCFGAGERVAGGVRFGQRGASDQMGVDKACPDVRDQVADHVRRRCQ